MNPAVLIPAILTYVRQRGGHPTKTKLLKLLYLLDIEAFTQKQDTLTGFEWIFYKYGPWSAQYDELLNELREANVIKMQAGGGRPDLETVFIDSAEPVELSRAFPAIVEELQARRIIEAWAAKPTGELLDYVYFHTAPMREAQRGRPLDFRTLLQEESPPEYRRTESRHDPKEKKNRQRVFQEAMKGATKNQQMPHFAEPRYDSEFWKAMDTLDRDPD